MNDTLFCPMAKQLGCLGDTCMFWSSKAEYCMIIDNYLKTLETGVQLAALAHISGQTIVYNGEPLLSTSLILFEKFSTSVHQTLHLMRELAENQDCPDHYRQKLKKIRHELLLLFQDEIDLES